jgi:hypothetical protein
VGSLQWALSWLIVVAVGLAPLLVYWLAWLIGLAIRRKARRPRASNPPVEIEGEPPQRRGVIPTQ